MTDLIANLEQAASELRAKLADRDALLVELCKIERAIAVLADNTPGKRVYGLNARGLPQAIMAWAKPGDRITSLSTAAFSGRGRTVCTVALNRLCKAGKLARVGVGTFSLPEVGQ